MKKVSYFLLLALLSLSASAYDFMVDGLCYNKNPDGTSVTVTYENSSYSSPRYTNLSGALSIPPSVTNGGKTYTVTSIGERAFSGCSGLTSVIIPNSVTSIGVAAFSGCSGLTSVTIPNSIPTITTSVFSGCSGLTNVTIPNSVTVIGNNAFSGCSGLTSVTIPNSVITIGNYAFSDCHGLTSVTIPVTYIGYAAFSGCSGLTSVAIGNSVTSIGERVFIGCGGLESVKVESGNITYDSRNDCNAIIETASNALIVGCKNTIIPYSVSSIGDYAFSGCSGLASVTIPYSVTSIGDCAFSGCSGLTSVFIPNSVTSIGAAAFYDCNGLTNVTIPNSVTSIGNNALEGTAWFNSQPNGLVYAGLVAYKYKGTMPSGTSVSLKSDTKGIAGSCFYNCTGLKSVTIPNSVATIGDYAFYYCNRLMGDLTIPNSVKTIGANAFSGCTGLAGAIIIGNAVKSIGNAAFGGCQFSTMTLTGRGASPIGYLWKVSENIKTLNIGSEVSSLRGLIVAPTTVNCYAEVPPTCVENTFTNYDGALHVPTASAAAYFTADYWQNFGNLNNDLTERVVLSQTTAALDPGGKLQLMATTTPNGAALDWSTNNSAVATVSDGGLVTAVAGGECDIFATLTGQPAIYASCHIATSYPDITLSLDKQNLALLAGERATLTPTVTPDNTGLTPTWTTSNASVATVSNGMVYAVGEGECDITATVLDKKETCHVTVLYSEITMTLNKQSLRLGIGDTSTLTATITPAVPGLTTTWVTSNASVATVSNGVVTGVGVGECDITVTVRDVSASCHVVVANMLLTFDRSKAYIGVNTLLTLLPTASPDVEVDFVATLSDPSVALVRIVNRSNAPAYCLVPEDLPLACFAPTQTLAPALAGQKAVQVMGLAAGKTTVTLSSAASDAIPATCEVTVVDISTVNRVINVVLDLSEGTPDDDIDGSGVVDIGDINALINVILGI